jgi:hypothetical protein
MFFPFALTLMIAIVENKETTQFEFLVDLQPRYLMHYLEVIYIGRLDATGQFVPDPKIPPKLLDLKSGVQLAGPAPPSLFDAHTRDRPEFDGRVYEFRAGRLIPGIIKQDMKTGFRYFYPDLDGKVIEMSDYLKAYDPKKSRIIYNLPGRIVKKGEGKK